MPRVHRLHPDAGLLPERLPATGQECVADDRLGAQPSDLWSHGALNIHREIVAAEPGCGPAVPPKQSSERWRTREKLYLEASFLRYSRAAIARAAASAHGQSSANGVARNRSYTPSHRKDIGVQ
ncbi:MAG: hypothetical protein ACJ73L_01430 [Actinomycetes bacterium]